MSRLAAKAELLKLSRVLERDVAELGFLEPLDARTLTQLRERVVSTMYESHDQLFERLARAGKLLPVALMAKVTVRAVGPWLGARVAGHMPVDRAVEMAVRLPVEFLADTCVQIDPRRVRALLPRIPMKVMRSVAAELVRRRDFITMGRFVGDLPEERAEQVMHDIHDEAALLEIAFFAEDHEHLTRVVHRLPDDRIVASIRTAREQDLWSRAIALMHYVDEALCVRLADLATSLEDEVLDHMLHSIQEENLWPDALPVLSRMSARARRRLLERPVLEDRQLMESVLETAWHHDLWGAYETVLAEAPPSLVVAGRELIADMEGVPDEVRSRLAELAG